MAIDIFEALFAMHVGTDEFGDELQEAERMAEDSSKRISRSFSTMQVAIATALSAAVVEGLRRSINATIAQADAAEIMAIRMGTSVEKAQELIGVMERLGVSGTTAERAITMLAFKIDNMNESLDPLSTKLGQLLGPLRDTQGNMLSMGEILDRVRQKFNSTGSELEKLQMSQEIFGRFLGGQMVKALGANEEEWERLRQQVLETGTVTKEQVELQNKLQNATAALDQSFSALQRSLGTVLVPILTRGAEALASILEKVNAFVQAHPTLTRTAVLILGIVAPVIALVGAFTLLLRGATAVATVLSALGLSSAPVVRQLVSLNTTIGALAAGESIAEARTRAHTQALQQQTAAVIANTAAQRGRLTAVAGSSALAIPDYSGLLASQTVAGQLKSALPTIIGTLSKAMLVAGVAVSAWQVGRSIDEYMKSQGFDLSEKFAKMFGFISQEDIDLKNLAIAESKAAAAKIEAEKQVAENRQVEDDVSQKQVAAAQNKVKAAQEALKLGIGERDAVAEAVAAQEDILRKREQFLIKQLQLEGLTAEERLVKETQIQETRNQLAQLDLQRVNELFQSEELRLRASGQFHIQNEIRLLEQRLANEKIVGDERLRIEEQLGQRRKQFAEDMVRVSRQMGVIGAGEEIAFRQQQAEEALSGGDIIGAADQLAKVRDLALAEAERVMDFNRKIRIISLQEEIDFQQSKLDFVRGNAEKEMEIIGRIADLEKQQYRERLEAGLNYVQTVTGQLKAMEEAQRAGGETTSFERQRVEAGRAETELFRAAERTLGGGTSAELQKAVEVSQAAIKRFEDAQRSGAETSEALRQFVSGAAREILARASGLRTSDIQVGSREAPLQVGSSTSPAEGLSTSSLARGSEIPRLDTSFTDLAIRVRDVLLGTIPNIQSFSSAVGEATRRLAPQQGIFVGAEAQQFGRPLATGPGTPAPVTIPPGFSPAEGGGISPGALAVLVQQNREDSRRLTEAVSQLAEILPSIPESQRANAESIRQILQTAREQSGRVEIAFDENTGSFTTRFVERTIENALSR